MFEWFLFLTCLGLCLSMIFSASEASIFSLSRIDMASLHNLGLKEKYLKMLKNPEQLLFAILSGNELADYFASFSFATAITLLLSEEVRAPAFIIFSLLSFWIGDFFPKVIGFKLRTRLVVRIIPLTYMLYQILYPARSILYKLYLKLQVLIPEIKKPSERSSFTPVEQIILHTLDVAYEEKKISQTEREFIYGLFLSEKIPVSAIMTPRSEIVAFRDQIITLELLERIKLLPFNKFPVYTNTLDDVCGILYAKDIVREFGKSNLFSKRLSELVRPAYFVHENFKVRDLLFEFQKRHQKIALVVDEYGTLKGLITLEDILEELFGEFQSVKETLPQPVQKINSNHYLIAGKALLEEVRELLGLPFDKGILMDLKTVNGLMLTLFKGIPKEGDSIKFEDWEFRIKKTKGRKIVLVEAIKKA